MASLRSFFEGTIERLQTEVMCDARFWGVLRVNLIVFPWHQSLR